MSLKQAVILTSNNDIASLLSDTLQSDYIAKHYSDPDIALRYMLQSPSDIALLFCFHHVGYDCTAILNKVNADPTLRHIRIILLTTYKIDALPKMQYYTALSMPFTLDTLKHSLQ